MNRQRSGNGTGLVNLRIVVAAVGLACCLASAGAAQSDPCIGDCDANRTVSVGELIRGVNIALERTPLGECAALDRGGDGRITIDELIGAVGAALGGCHAG